MNRDARIQETDRTVEIKNNVNELKYAVQLQQVEIFETEDL